MSGAPRGRSDFVEGAYHVALLTLRRTLRGRRTLVALAPLLLPALLSLTVARGKPDVKQEQFAYAALSLYQFGIALPAFALVLATAFPWPESDEGTLSYWFTSPLRRSAVMFGRIVAAILVGVVLLPLGVLGTVLPLDGASVELAPVARTAVAATLLAYPAYIGLFAAAATWTRRGLVCGVVFILLENSLSFVSGTIARLTLVHYVRSMLHPVASPVGRRVLTQAARLDPPASTAFSVGVFVCAAAVSIGIALLLVERTEYRGRHAQPA